MINQLFASAHISPRSHPDIRVLLIDDAETDCVTYIRYLQADPEHQYRFFSADTLRVGMELWRSQSPNIVLLDLNLPDGDGLEFLEFLLPTATAVTKVPVIVLTGQGNERTAVRAMKLGAMDYLSKDDITPISLRKSVLAVIDYQNLAQQLARSQQQKELLAEIALRIHQSLDLSQILQSTVDGLRQLLTCDRAIIYQFQPDWSGWVTVESVCCNKLSILNQEIIDPCFAVNWHHPYCQGRTSQVNDREDGSLTPCYAKLLASIQVRANLVVPILQNESLWGLLIAHECQQPRDWEMADIHWVQQLATQVGIALQQATAYFRLQIELRERQQIETQLQQLNQELEERVAQRTLALRQSESQLRLQAEILTDIHDAVIATDCNGIIESWNPGAERIFGYQTSEVIGQNIRILHDRLESLVAQLMAPLLKNDQHEVEIVCRAKSGKLIDVNLRLSVSRDEQGKVVRLLGVATDISVAKRSKAAQQQAEAENQVLRERLQFILSSSPAVIYTRHVGSNFATTFVSDNVIRHFGHTPDELINQPNFWLNCLHPDDCPRVLQELTGILEQGHRVLEYRLRHQNGEYRWVQDEVRLVYSASGEPRELVGYFADISDRHQIKAQLKNLSDRLTLALESAEIGTWDWDLAGDVNWDDRMYTLYGLEHLPHSATYQDWVDALHPDDRIAMERQLEQSLTLGKLDTDFRIILPDGTIRYIKAMGLMHYDPLGQPQRMVGINYDITERKLAEATLLRYTQEVEDLYNNAPCGYHSLDAQGNLIRVNETELQWLGYTRDEMIGKPLTAFFTDESRQAFITNYSTFCQEGRVRNLEYEMVCKDGSILPVLISATAVNDDRGTLLYSRATMLDIRDRKAAEAQLRQTNVELMHATRLKDEFLANMSHELRTPLNAILGLSEALQDQILGVLNERQQKAIDTVERSGQHLLELINDILDLSKISSGKMELVLAQAVVQNLCESSLLFVKQQACQKQIQLSSHIATSIRSIVVDERRIRQVLINLLTNAVKFTPPGGQVSLEVKSQCFADETSPAIAPPPAQPDGSVADAWLLFSVTDTGIGIAPQDLSRLFQPFVQIDSSLNRQQAGTGLGLAMVKQIIELHGGWATVKSSPGQGSCFTVSLPCQSAGTGPLATQSASTVGSPIPMVDQAEAAIAPRILLAEDNAANVATFTAYLSAHNYQIIVAQNGEEAVTLAKTEHPDLILMDIQMPKMDGLEATRLIRADEQLNDVPIIALTALAMPQDEERCLIAGANQYLSKPIKLRRLAEVIQQWVGTRI